MIKEILKDIQRQFLGYKSRHVLSQLKSHQNRKVNAIGHAMDQSLNKNFSSEEKEVIHLIEKRRLFLLSSDSKIEVIDYGAGSPQSRRSMEEMHTGIRSMSSVASVCKGSKPKFWLIFLFKLILKLKPFSCVELGTCVGISASYQGAALTMNGKGNLQTLEGSPEIVKIAKETIDGLHLQNISVVTGPFHKTLKDVLKSSQPIDYFFNDGHHSRDAVLKYFYEALPYLSNEAVMIFDDIDWSPDMRQAWVEIENNDRVQVSVDLKTIGIVIIGNNPAMKEKFRLPLN